MRNINKVERRNLRIEDYKELQSSMVEAYFEMEFSYWKEHHICKHPEIFPEGQLVIVVDNKVVGSALPLMHEHGSVRILKDRRHDLYRISKLK